MRGPIHAAAVKRVAAAAKIRDLGRALTPTVLVAIAMTTTACVHRGRTGVATAPPARIGMTETGVASWYGRPYDGRRTASGEIYDMEKLTAAHRKLPFETWVEVTNLDNRRKVAVRITDRGPFVGNRIIDLSLAAARDIDMVRSGTARVRLKVIRPPATTTSR